MDARLQAMLVDIDAPIRQAMNAIDKGTYEIALAVDSSQRLVGTISDGDIRRALLAGQTLDSPVGPCTNPRPIVVTPKHSRAEVLDIMRARSVAQIPIVDEAGCLAGLHIMKELIGAVERPNAAVIMCGGRGVRLAPLTERIPKPMLPVAGRPILERMILHLIGGGIQRIFLAVNYLAEVIEDHFGDGHSLGAHVTYVREDADVPLGTGGALRLLSDEPEVLAHPFLVLNGDLLSEFPVGELLDYHAESAAVATVAVRKHTYEVPYGVVTSADQRWLSGIVEKPVASWLINAGIYVLEGELCARVPAGQAYPLTGLLEACLEQSEPVSIWNLEDDWHDVGRIADLRRARGEL